MAILNNLGGTTLEMAVLTQALNGPFSPDIIGPSSMMTSLDMHGSLFL